MSLCHACNCLEICEGELLKFGRSFVLNLSNMICRYILVVIFVLNYTLFHFDHGELSEIEVDCTEVCLQRLVLFAIGFRARSQGAFEPYLQVLLLFFASSCRLLI